MPKRVQRHGLPDAGRIGRFVEKAAQLAGAHRLAALGAWKLLAAVRFHTFFGDGQAKGGLAICH